jgi:hypothetical protein
MAGSDPPAGTGPGLVHKSFDRLQLQPLPLAFCSPAVAPDWENVTLTKPELAAVPPLWTVIVFVADPPATNGTPPSAMFSVRSIGLLPFTGVSIDAELLLVLSSLAFDTDADAEMSVDPDGTAPLILMAGRDPPAGTGPGLVQVAEGISQLHPPPEADVVENGSGMLTVTSPELAEVPLL